MTPTTTPAESPVETQAERTRLAWRRTTLTAAGVVLLALSTTLRHRPGAAALTGLAVMSLALMGLVAVAYQRIAELSGRRMPAGRSPGRLTVLVLALAVPAIVLVVVLVAATTTG